MRKVRILLFASALLFLAACMPAEAYNGPTAYEMAQRSQATAQAAQLESEYYGKQLTATAEAPIVHITETAAAVQVQNQIAQSTQMAQATSVAANYTATAMQQSALSTATALQNEADVALARQHAEQTAVANQAIRDDLELERQRITNQSEALRPYFMLAFAGILMVIVVMLFIRQLRFKPVARDARGDAVPILDTVDAVVVDIDRNPNFATSTHRKDMPQLPPITPARQDLVTMRDQLLDLATRGLPDNKKNEQRKQIAAREMTQPILPAGKQEIMVIPPEQAIPVIKDVIPQIMQDAVEGEIIEEGKL